MSVNHNFPPHLRAVLRLAPTTRLGGKAREGEGRGGEGRGEGKREEKGGKRGTERVGKGRGVKRVGGGGGGWGVGGGGGLIQYVHDSEKVNILLH